MNIRGGISFHKMEFGLSFGHDVFTGNLELLWIAFNGMGSVHTVCVNQCELNPNADAIRTTRRLVLLRPGWLDASNLV